MEKYNVDYFIKKFEAIPEYRWTTNKLKDGNKRCAQGHCMTNFSATLCKRSPNDFHNPEVTALRNLFPTIGSNLYYTSIAYINDGHDPDYQQPTPKQRVLATLYDLKEKEVTKERIVYVTVDLSVRELQKKELILN